MSFFQFLYANSIVLSVFSAALASAYSICQFYNVPFYNLETISEDVEKIKNNGVSLYFGSIYIVLTTQFFIDIDSHSWTLFLGNVIAYTLLIESLYYMYYVWIYPKWEVLQNLHSSVYPLDRLHINMFSLSCYLGCLHLPTLLLYINTWEYVLVMYIYATMGFLTASTIIEKLPVFIYQEKHNPCLVFPLCDYFVHYLDKSGVLSHNKLNDFLDTDQEDEDEISLVDKDGDFVKITSKSETELSNE
jgi:hypothetical protein